MYNIGDVIMYANMGMCKVMDIEQKLLCEAIGEKQYYKLQAVFEDDAICYVPTDSDVFMRKAITKEEAEELISKIPQVEEEAYINKNIKELAKHYDEKINAGDCKSLVELILSIDDKKDYMEKHKKKLGVVDEKYLKKARNLLYEEFAVSLGMKKENVPKYITRKVEAITAQ